MLSIPLTSGLPNKINRDSKQDSLELDWMLESKDIELKHKVRDGRFGEVKLGMHDIL